MIAVQKSCIHASAVAVFVEWWIVVFVDIVSFHAPRHLHLRCFINSTSTNMCCSGYVILREKLYSLTLSAKLDSVQSFALKLISKFNSDSISPQLYFLITFQVSPLVENLWTKSYLQNISKPFSLSLLLHSYPSSLPHSIVPMTPTTSLLFFPVPVPSLNLFTLYQSSL